MNFEVDVHLLTGVMVGFEFVPLPDDDCNSLVLDLLLLRIIIYWY